MMKAPGPTIAPGSVFAGRYLIERRVGKGGMGTVYKAVDKLLDITVAVKIMNPDLTQDAKTLARFKREVILARKVAHPNVCRIYDLGESEGVHYVSMEYLEGMTLADMLHTRGALAPAEGLAIIKQVLQALQEAHRAGIIHRDLKPQNIMVDRNQRAFIMDFGISVSAEVTRLTTTGQMIGTPRYMAPEQFGDAHADHRIDLYAVGIIMYEMFTGRLPFEANTPAGAMYAHLYTRPAPLSEILPGFPADLDLIILKILEKNPQDRIQTAGELLSVLESVSVPEVAEERTMLLPRPGSVPQEPDVTEQEKETHWGAVIGVIIFLMVAAVAGVWFWKFRNPPEPVPPVVSAAGVRPQPSVTTPLPSEMPAEIAAETQPEQTVASALPSPETNATQSVVEQPPEPASQTGETTSPEAAAVPAVVDPSQPGHIVYEGEFPVSIYSGRTVVLNTAAASEAELPPGSYNLTLVSKANAIIRQTQKVEVKPGQTTTIIAPAMAKLTLTCDPGDCKVSVDMIVVGEGPLSGFPIQAGNHHLRVQWESIGKEKGVFLTVAANEAMTLKAVSNDTATDVYHVIQP